MKKKKHKNGETNGSAGGEKLSRRAAIKRIAAVFAGAAISATGAAGDPPAYSSSYVSLNLPYVRYSSFAYLSLSYSSFLQYSSIYVPPWRP
ncbi:MAG TPA: hypothetical protein HPP81_04795 [Deltaproteobacteria bacterium]|jgi:hypothetical protein|nr:hypothetical protein [Deltaproteobacteria bacterium]